MKQNQLFNAIPALRKLANATGLPGRQLIALLRLTDRADKENGIYQAAILRVYRECGEGEGNSYRVTPGHEEELADRIREIGDMEVEDLAEITLDYHESMNLSVNDIASLRGVVNLNFKEDEDERDHNQRAG